ncbi:fasciclin domain-containing protein [Lujinxingia sediminis]|uniref:Fasciclin domain-containing protein n=1 Tax=Lujinxingia sediminis TaxID=2480984 RepID=A0ABY0CNF1_9DELT|nr:fasciclin domain-containing protein [Lujinxingia sediminis]RVU41490.1 fasciclin domain-containing protein [Lujinxingia sediminis]
MNKTLKLLVLFVLGAFIIACGDDDDDPDTIDDVGVENDAGDDADVEEDTGGEDDAGEDTDVEDDTGDNNDLNIVETAQANEDFSLLVEAVVRAGLDDDLAAEGPFTVFAPTNAAFEAADLDSEAIQAMDPVDLAAVLTYHVIDGEVLAANVSAGAVATLNGAPALIEDADGLTYATAPISATDVIATNGVIHVIDEVVFPPELNAAETATQSGNFTGLLAAVAAAELGETVATGGPFTVFAPADPAFDGINLDDYSTAELADILTFHVVPGYVSSFDLVSGNVATVNGAEAEVVVDGATVTYEGAAVTSVNILSSNAIIHVIDSVVLPPAE